MKELLNEIVPWLNGGLFIGLISMIVYRRKINAETTKVIKENKKIDDDREITLVKFYQEQVQSLTIRYDELEKKFEDKERDHYSCEERIIELEQKYVALLSKVNLLSKNIKP